LETYNKKARPVKPLEQEKRLNKMRRIVFFVISALICGVFTSCELELQGEVLQVEIIELSQNVDDDTATYAPQDGDENADDLEDGEDNADDPEDGEENTDVLQGVIVYPKFGKYGLNVLADDFVEATRVDGGKPGQPVEYSLNAEVPAGAGLKIVVITKRNNDINAAWGGFYASSLDNWLYTYYDTETRSNTFTVFESGKRADVTVTFVEDCIIQYYENGATTPTKVKEISVSPDVVTEEKPEPDTDGLQGVITYPKFGKYGLNILADDFVVATHVGGGKPGHPIEYSVNAEVPAGAGLKIVIITKSKGINAAWGGFYPSSLDNWLSTNYNTETRSNTFTVYESGKCADFTVTFIEDCIVEYYENGSKTPTKVKEISVSMDVVTEEKPEPDTDGLEGLITYPKNGKTGLLNILADDFVEATHVGGGKPGQPVEYAVNAEVPAGAGLKIVIKTKNKSIYSVWGGFYADLVENWLYTPYNTETSSNTFTVYESGKRADFTVTFFEDFIVEYYENGSKMPTKVKEIKVKK